MFIIKNGGSIEGIFLFIGNQGRFEGFLIGNILKIRLLVKAVFKQNLYLTR